MSICRVAQEAGVSPATVSRYINNSAYVSPAVAKHIEAAMRKVGYAPRTIRPGPRARQRGGIRTGHVAMLLLTRYGPADLYKLPTMGRVLAGVHVALDRNGLDLVMTQWSSHAGISPMVARGNLDGILVLGSAQIIPAPLLEILRHTPTVWFFRGHADFAGEFDHVFYDNDSVGVLAADYLHDRRHQRLAFVAADPAHPAYAARRDAFVAAIARQGGEVAVLEGEPATPADYPREVMRLAGRFAALSPRPSGVFVASDDALLAFFHALRTHGIEPGRDVDLIGCNNDEPYMTQMVPRPATIDLKLEELGQRAVEQLLWRMGHRHEESRAEVWIHPAVVPAETVIAKPARQKRRAAPATP